MRVSDAGSGHGGPKPVVDVDDRYSRGATIEHCQQGGYPAEARPVPNARWHGDDRRCDETANDRRKRTVHPGDNDDDVSSGQRVAVRDDAMKACHADIVRAIDSVAKRPCSHHRLFSHPRVARPGSHHQDIARDRQCMLRREIHRSRDLVDIHHWKMRGQCGPVSWVGSCHQEPFAAIGQDCRDVDGLGRRLTWRKDDLWISLAKRAVVVDRREAECLYGLGNKRCQGALGWDRTGGNLL